MPELERIYTIPLRKEWEKAPRYKRAKKAVKAVKEFLVRHMKIRDRDLKKIKIERWLNMHLWQQGIKKPPVRVKVKAVKDAGIVRVELAELPKRALKEAKKEEKAEKKGKKGKAEKKEERVEKKAETEEKVGEVKAEEAEAVEGEEEATAKGKK